MISVEARGKEVARQHDKDKLKPFCDSQAKGRFRTVFRTNRIAAATRRDGLKRSGTLSWGVELEAPWVRGCLATLPFTRTCSDRLKIQIYPNTPRHLRNAC